MDDLISRQAAIERIDAVFPVDPMRSEYAQGIASGAALAKTYVVQLPSAQQWIPVEKETPILPNIVLVCDSLGKILFDSYIDGSWTYCPYVVAWMSLPEPYKEVNG